MKNELQKMITNMVALSMVLLLCPALPTAAQANTSYDDITTLYGTNYTKAGTYSLSEFEPMLDTAIKDPATYTTFGLDDGADNAPTLSIGTDGKISLSVVSKKATLTAMLVGISRSDAETLAYKVQSSSEATQLFTVARTSTDAIVVQESSDVEKLESHILEGEKTTASDDETATAYRYSFCIDDYVDDFSLKDVMEDSSDVDLEFVMIYAPSSKFKVGSYGLSAPFGLAGASTSSIYFKFSDYTTHAAAATAVATQISALGSKPSARAVKSALSAYASLSDVEKALVPRAAVIKLADAQVYVGSFAKGAIKTAFGGRYKVTKKPTSSINGTVTLMRAAKKTAKTFAVPHTVKLADGYTYKIAAVKAKAFKTNKKLKTLIVKAKALTTKKSVHNCLKGSKVKIVKIKLAGAAKRRVKKAFKKFAAKAGIVFK